MSQALIQSILAGAESRIEQMTGQVGRIAFFPEEFGEVVSNVYGELFFKCCKTLKVTPDEVREKSRKKEVVATRQAIALVLKTKYPKMPLVMMARYLGFADHTSVLHNINTAKDFLNTRDEFFMMFYTPLIPFLDDHTTN